MAAYLRAHSTALDSQSHAHKGQLQVKVMAVSIPATLSITLLLNTTTNPMHAAVRHYTGGKP